MQKSQGYYSNSNEQKLIGSLHALECLFSALTNNVFKVQIEYMYYFILVHYLS
jgi:hypothetical protein